MDVCFGQVFFQREKVSGNVTLHQTFQHRVYGRGSDWLESVAATDSASESVHFETPSLFYILPIPLF